MTLRFTSSNSLSFENSTGQLFNVSNNVTTGTIFSVNDISGIPLISVNASGNVSLVPLGGANVGIGTSQITSGNVLSVYGGNVFVAGGLGVAGNITVTGQLNIKTYIENSNSPAISSNTLSIDLSTTTVFTVAMNANITTFTIVNTPQTANAVSSFILVFTYTGAAYTVVWPTSTPNIRWPGGVAPTLSSGSGKRDVFTFFTTDNGVSYNAFNSGQNL